MMKHTELLESVIRYLNNWSFIKGTPVKIATDVPDELISIFEEQNYHYMGIVAGKEYARTYSPLALLRAAMFSVM